MQSVSGNLDIFTEKFLQNKGIKHNILWRNLSDDGDLSIKQNCQWMQAEEINGYFTKTDVLYAKKIISLEIPETLYCLTLRISQSHKNFLRSQIVSGNYVPEFHHYFQLCSYAAFIFEWF